MIGNKFRKISNETKNKLKGSHLIYDGNLPKIKYFSWSKKILKIILKEPKIRYILLILPRQAKKDITALTICSLYMNLKKPRHITYIGQNLKSTREIIFDVKLTDGEPYYSVLGRVIPYRSMGMVKSVNGSILQIYGCDRIERSAGAGVVGRNSALYVFTEFALQNESIWNHIRPILSQSQMNSRAIFITTPRGRNHVYEMYEKNKNKEEWLCIRMSMHDFEEGEYNKENAYKDLESGMPEELFKQEYECKFDAMGDVGLLYSSYLVALENKGRVKPIKKVSYIPTYTAWDLGVSDSTVILFFQIDLDTKEIYVVDMIEGRGKTMYDYYELVIEKNYNYRAHFLPHDSIHETLHNPHNFSIDRQFKDILKENDDPATVRTIPIKKIHEGVNIVRQNFPRMYIDPKRCERLLYILRRYRIKLDEKTGTYDDVPNRQQGRDVMDALRYMMTAVVTFIDKEIYT